MKPYQKKLFDEVVDALSRYPKAVLNGTCGIGKTFITICLIQKWIKEGKRVLVSTYSQNGIKQQWYREILKWKNIKSNQFGVLCSIDDCKNFESNAYTIKNMPNNLSVVLTLPQTAYRNMSHLGKFDYIVIDEAHNYLDCKNSDKCSLKQIISKCSNESTKILGLTATAFDIISEDGFFGDIPEDSCIIYDIMDAMQNKNITGLDIYPTKFNFKIDGSLYRDDGNLTREGEVFVRSKIHSAKKVEDVLYSTKGKSLIISLPLQDRDICDSINRVFGRGSCILNTMKSLDPKNSVDQFHNNNSARFMVVINKCGVGYDFDDLENVIDLTFTKSPQLIIQRMLRPCRLSKNIPNKIGKYYYCCDQSHSNNSIQKRIGQSIWLSKRDGILAYRQNVNVNGSRLFPEGTSTDSGDGIDDGEEPEKIDVSKWLVDYDMEWSKKMLGHIEIRGDHPFITQIKKIINMIPKSDHETFQRMKYTINISHDADSFMKNIEKYHIIKG